MKFPNVFTLALLALLGACYFGTFADLDWSWQVRTGEVLLQTGSLHLTDSFTYTIQGRPLHDFEWLYEVGLYLVWSVWGIGGLKFLKVLLVFLPLFLMARRLHREGVRRHGIALAFLAAILVISPAWNLRPLYITTIGLLLVSGWLHEHCNGRRPLPWYLPLAMLLWGNMHPGVITGQGLLAGAVAWEWLNRWWKWNLPLDGPGVRRLTVVGFLGLAASMVCPDPIERLRYTFKPELRDPIMRIFGEMQPLHAFLGATPILVLTVWTIALLTLLTVVVRFRHYRMWELALLAGTALLGSYAYRSTMDWTLVMLSLSVPHLKEMLAAAARVGRRRPGTAFWLRLDTRVKSLFLSPWLRFQPSWILGGMGCLLAVSLVPPLARRMPLQDSAEWPVAALDHIERQGWSGRFFGPPDYGAYVGWRLGKKGLAYADTRGFFFDPVLLEDSHFVPQLGPDWERRLDRILNQYRTDWFLLETTGPRGELWRKLRGRVEPAYLDEASVLLSADQVRQALGSGDLAAR